MAQRHDDPRVQIRPSRESDAASFNEAVVAVAGEKWYIATVDGFGRKQTERAYLQSIVEGSLPQVLAVAENEVVGFCDILPNPAKGFTHVGRLGMGVRFEWRRQGIGRRMLDACLSLARSAQASKESNSKFSLTTSGPYASTNPSALAMKV